MLSPRWTLVPLVLVTLLASMFFPVRLSTAAEVNPAPPQSSERTNFYAAPDGQPNGKGNKKKPWDLQTALNHPKAVMPGSTIFLRGGTYNGKFISRLAGSPAAPIVVSSYPGEWARIDGFKTTKLAAPLPDRAENMPCTFTDLTGFTNGSGIFINDEAMSLHNIRGNTGTCNRANVTPCETISAHKSGDAVVLGGNTLTISGSDTIYRDFEVTNSNSIRMHLNGCTNTQVGPFGRGTGIWHDGLRTRLVNLVVHNNDNGIFSTPRAAEGEIYGCIVFNNGYEHGGGERTSGHGLYVQNNQTEGYKRIAEVITFNNFKSGIKAVSQTGPTIGFEFEGVVGFNNSAMPHLESKNRSDGIFVGANDGFADRIIINECFLYQPPETDGGHLGLGYVNDNGTITVTRCYMGGGAQSVSVGVWKSLNFSDNTLYVTTTEQNVNRYLASMARISENYTWNNNTYYNLSERRPFYHSRSSALDFQRWKESTHFDRESVYSESAPPPKVFIRNNLYERGRAHIIIYNWGLSSTVGVDLSAVIAPGRSFELRDAQNFLASPILSGVYSGGLVQIPMTDLRTAKAVGYESRVPHTAPEFGVFVLMER